MSKIFDALKQAELARADDRAATTRKIGPPKRPERRRTARLNVQVPLFVYGYTQEGDPFYDYACSIAINAHGGLMFMLTTVRPGQRLLVTKKENEETTECLVLSVRARLALGVDVAFEFPAPMSNFWGNWERQKTGL